MVCHRCILAVEHEAKNLNLEIASLQLGELKLKTQPTNSILSQFKKKSKYSGF